MNRNQVRIDEITPSARQLAGRIIENLPWVHIAIPQEAGFSADSGVKKLDPLQVGIYPGLANESGELFGACCRGRVGKESIFPLTRTGLQMSNENCDAQQDPGGQISLLLAAAREGTGSDVGRLFEATRRYLLLVANRSLDTQLHAKIGPSDLVQETFIDAHRDFKRFTGESESELFAWLCRILQHKAADAGRRFRGTAKRNVEYEVALGDPCGAGVQVAAESPSPSAVAVSCEKEQRMSDALARLPIDYRQVIELRSLERLSFQEVGRRMGRSEDAAGKLWFRAIRKLRSEMVGRDGSGSWLT